MFGQRSPKRLELSLLSLIFSSSVSYPHIVFSQSLREEFTQKESRQAQQEDQTISNIVNDFVSLGLIKCFNLKGKYPMSIRRLPGEGVYVRTPDLTVRFENITPGYDKFCISKDGNIYQRFIHTTQGIWMFLKVPVGEEVPYSGPDGNPLGFYDKKTPVLLKVEKAANGNYLFSYKHVKASEPGARVECSLKTMNCAFKTNIYDGQARLGQLELIEIELATLKQSVIDKAKGQAKHGLKTNKGDTIWSPNSF